MKFKTEEDLIRFVSQNIILVSGCYYFTTNVKHVLATASIMKKAKSEFADNMWKRVIPREANAKGEMKVKNKNVNGYNILPSESAFKTRIHLFKNTYQFDDEVIENSLKRYLNRVYAGKIPYPKTLLNFIEHAANGSELAAYCEEYCIEDSDDTPSNIKML